MPQYWSMPRKVPRGTARSGSANDIARYLLAGSQLLTGGAAENLNTISEYNGGHGPGVPALVAFFILLFGRDTVALVWALRMLTLLGPLLAYLLAKRISGSVAGLIAAGLVSLLAFNVKATVAILLIQTLRAGTGSEVVAVGGRVEISTLPLE